MKKIISVLLVALLACTLAVPAFAQDTASEDDALRFGDDGKFTILQLSDFQDSIIFRPMTKDFVNYLLDTVDPDLVVLTGDNIGPDSAKTYSMGVMNINNFMSIFEEKGVKVAMVFGNHDADRNAITKEQQWEVYERYNCFVGVRDSEELTGYGTYNLPVMSSDGEKTAFNLWFFDSQEGNTENDLGGYGCVAKDQIEWYKKTENALTAQNGGEPVPSMAFQHIIVPEVYSTFTKLWQKNEDGTIEIYNNADVYDSDYIVEWQNGAYAFPKQYIDEDTFLGESPAPPVYSNGQADALVETGNVLGIVSGHDHVNSFVVPYRGMDIIQTPTCSFGDYGDENRGARVITISEENTSEYETDVIFFREVYDLSDPEMYNRYVFNSDCDDFTIWDRILAMFKWLAYRAINSIGRLFNADLSGC